MTPLPLATSGPPLRGRWLPAGLMLLLGTLSLGMLFQTVLEEEPLAGAWLSPPSWQQLVTAIGGNFSLSPQGMVTATVPAGPVFGLAGLLTLAGWLAGGVWLSRTGAGPLPVVLAAWGQRGWRWWLLAAFWWVVWISSLIAGTAGLTVFLANSVPFCLALLFNLWGAEWFALRRQSPQVLATLSAEPEQAARRAWQAVWGAIAVYTFVFTAMNWGLWFNLQVPHGDSAMYEEHLWNVTHGKGFRSYLDQGLFLGEHIQVVHLLLIPLHLLWPSHLLMELCDSLILALTALPVYSIAKRHTGSPRAAAYLAMATLLYFPLQYLDISIDFKTFRPSAFGIPLLLAAIDQMEQRRWGRMTLLLLLTLSAEEVFAIPVALAGLWLALSGGMVDGAGDPVTATALRRRNRAVGGAVCLLSGLYLLLAVRVVIPWFREGDTVHYARYFTKFGESPIEILGNMLMQPGLVLGEVLTAPTFLYATALLVPLGCLPLLSPGRLATGLPLFALLVLNELSRDPPGPFHHFHAPLLPLLLWAAAAGLGRLARLRCGGSPALVTPLPAEAANSWNTAICGARFALGCALISGVAYTLSPLGTRFWDPGRIVAARPTYWRSLYLPDERARAWREVAPLIPPEARVAATDFVHARLTHCERSYDYSGYVRRVAGYEDRVPEDTDYIVIDLRHPYSASVLGEVRTAADVRELREQPGEWELLTPPDNLYFVVLKRLKPAAG